jgi:hypothetical protein
MHELARRHDNDHYRVPEGMLVGLRGNIARYGLQQLQETGLVANLDNHWSLTEAGLKKASGDMRNRELWEAYRLYHDDLQLPLIPEDRTKSIDSLLPASIVAKLEEIIDANR